MNVTVRKIGNSEGIIIPKEVLDRLGVRAGDTLELKEESGVVTMRPSDGDFQRQLAAAEFLIEKYKVALKKLAE